MKTPGRNGPRNRKKQARNRYVFTTADCKKGYQAALQKCSHDIHKYAWLYYRIRGWYRRKRREQ